VMYEREIDFQKNLPYLEEIYIYSEHDVKFCFLFFFFFLFLFFVFCFLFFCFFC
jgi:hypothetical protein